MTRRTFLSAAAAATLKAAPRTKMGIATTSYMTVLRPRDTLEFLEHANALGAGGIQASLSSQDPAYLKKLRARAEELGMYLEVMVGLPKTNDAAAFERMVGAAKAVGASVLRAGCLSGRRYETFHTLAEWQTFVSQSMASLDRALPVLERQRVRLALENHKDWTAEELVAIIRNRKSEFLGVCLDTGNNISLLDDPMEVVDKLAPYAFATHLKDMAVEPYEDGFLLSEVPLGEGMLDVRRIVTAIAQAHPETHLSLEMITRDPLKVPCLTDNYWATFPQRDGLYLARTLRLVRSRQSARRLPMLEGLDHAAQLRLEEDNVKQSLHYARERLGL